MRRPGFRLAPNSTRLELAIKHGYILGKRPAGRERTGLFETYWQKCQELKRPYVEVRMLTEAEDGRCHVELNTAPAGAGLTHLQRAEMYRAFADYAPGSTVVEFRRVLVYWLPVTFGRSLAERLWQIVNDPALSWAAVEQQPHYAARRELLELGSGPIERFRVTPERLRRRQLHQAAEGFFVSQWGSVEE